MFLRGIGKAIGKPSRKYFDQNLPENFLTEQLAQYIDGGAFRDLEVLEQHTGLLVDAAVACQRKSFQLCNDIDFYITPLNTVLIIMTLEGKLIIHAQNNSAFGT